jgi:hypothetical protein
MVVCQGANGECQPACQESLGLTLCALGGAAWTQISTVLRMHVQIIQCSP